VKGGQTQVHKFSVLATQAVCPGAVGRPDHWQGSHQAQRTCELVSDPIPAPDAAAVARGEDGLVLIAEHAVARRAGTTTWVNLWANQ
jgi:hypothetical protein